MKSRINYNLQDYSIIHERNCIHMRRKICFFYMCESHEFVTFNGQFNKNSAKHSGMILELHDISFFTSKQDASKHERIWEEKLTNTDYDILNDVIYIEKTVDEYRMERFGKVKI